MQIIANNITTRNPRVTRILEKGLLNSSSRETTCPGLRDIAESCCNAGADILDINLQQHRSSPEMMRLAVNEVQQVVDCQLCLSAGDPAILEAGLQVCKRPPIVNYISFDSKRLQDILPLAVHHKAGLVLLISDPARPVYLEQMLEKTAVLVGAARESGIPSEHLFLDPGIYHITRGSGQSHLVDAMEWLRVVPDMFEPSVKTTCWLGNISSGAPAQLRPVIENMLLALLDGLGLSSVFMDVLRRENRRAMHLLNILHNKEVYADSILSI